MLISVKTILPLLFFIIPIIVSSQEVVVQTVDYNGDGHIDTLSSWYGGGSGFGGKYCILKNGATNEKFELNTAGCFCQITKAVPIPPRLKEEANKFFLAAIEKQILPQKQDSVDHSLRWILNVNHSNQVLSDNIYFDLKFSSPPKWSRGEIKLPDTYYIDVKGNTLDKLYENELEHPDWYNPKKNEGWLIYYAHNHYRNPEGDSLTLVDSTQNFLAYKTSHGLIIQRDNSYAWLFVNDFNVTGGPGKLRWESIKKGRIVDNFIIVQQNLHPDIISRIFIIDIESGICGRIKLTANYNGFHIENNKLIIENSSLKKSLLLDDLINELRKQNK